MKQLEENSEIAVIISREHAHLMQKTYQYYCFDKSELIYEFALKFSVKKQFAHLNELNSFIKMSSASGLIEKWRLEYQPKVKPITKRHIQPLSTESAFGLFMLFAFYNILLISFSLFEKYVHKKARETNPLRFWQLIEMLIDPDRHFLLESKMV